jgi:hypothetical protein
LPRSLLPPPPSPHPSGGKNCSLGHDDAIVPLSQTTDKEQIPRVYGLWSPSRICEKGREWKKEIKKERKRKKKRKKNNCAISEKQSIIVQQRTVKKKKKKKERKKKERWFHPQIEYQLCLM